MSEEEKVTVWDVHRVRMLYVYVVTCILFTLFFTVDTTLAVIENSPSDNARISEH